MSKSKDLKENITISPLSPWYFPILPTVEFVDLETDPSLFPCIPESIVLWVCFKATKKAYIFERCVYKHYLETSVLKAFYYFIWCMKSQ